MRRFFFLSFAPAVLFNALSWWIIGAHTPASEAPFIIRYQWGSSADVFGAHSMLFAVPVLGLIILAINAMIAFSAFPKHPAYARCFAAVTALCEIVVAVYAWIITGVNAF